MLCDSLCLSPCLSLSLSLGRTLCFMKFMLTCAITMTHNNTDLVRCVFFRQPGGGWYLYRRRRWTAAGTCSSNETNRDVGVAAESVTRCHNRHPQQAGAGLGQGTIVHPVLTYNGSSCISRPHLPVTMEGPEHPSSSLSRLHSALWNLC